MCFGSKTVQTDTKTSTANPVVANAATSNINTAENTLNNGTLGKQYDGPLTAAITPQQQSSIDTAGNIANNGTGADASSLINSYAKAPAGSISSPTINAASVTAPTIDSAAKIAGTSVADPNSISSQMSPYMNQYVMNALAPQMHQMDITNAADQNRVNAAATSSGAFGDARAGIEASNTAFNNNVQREGVIGNAYNAAFNTAIGAGAQDVSNQMSAANTNANLGQAAQTTNAGFDQATKVANANYKQAADTTNAGFNQSAQTTNAANSLTAQTTNANLGETALARSLGGANALESLQNQQLGAQGTVNTLAQQDTAAEQAKLTANYNNWLQAQQSQIQGQQSANATTLAGATALPATTTGTTAKPDNSGLSALGSIGGALLLSDRRAKADISKVGKLKDGQNVYAYHYKDDPNRVMQIGLMAQEVKKRRPDAVAKRPDGYLAVDYGKATALARAIGA